ncbi:MAG: nitroreductase/quinone reductase family protein [Acidimicrobiales bacterium]|jgi:deazaflavin-dependent oxidoreductase (nitroreductase family)
MNDEETLRFNESNIAEFRASHGRIASFGEAPLLLLTTVGAKSGQQRTSPMMYLQDDDDANLVYVFASAAGADQNPAWFHNLIANASIDVEIGDDRHHATAEALTEPKRTETYSTQADRYPGFAGYQEKTTRVIPVIALTLEHT